MNKMRCFILKMTVLVLSVVFVGCFDKKTNDMSENFNETMSSEPDTTVYGVCGDGTAMHTLQLLTDVGDTLEYSLLNNFDEGTDVQGGLMSGDRMAVVGTMLDGNRIATKVINVTTLLGKWTSIDKNFEFEEGGTVKSSVKLESKTWTSWKIHNGHLLLDKDTFDINTLGADSLYLENKEGIFVYKRQQ